MEQIADNRIALIGLRGSGKTTVGKRLAERLGYRFFDSDRIVEAQAGMSIREIFETEGEAAFRRREEEVIGELLQATGVVLALGGGAILSRATRGRLAVAARVLFLEAPLDVLAARIAGDPRSIEQRPSLTDSESLVDELRQLWQERRAAYLDASDDRIDTAGPSVDRVVDDIVRRLRGASGRPSGGA